MTLASASLSAIYYASQAPSFTLAFAGLSFAPMALGLGGTAFALDLVKPEMLRIATAKGHTSAQRAAAALLFAVLALASMVAVDGLLMRFRSDWAAGRGNAIQAHKDASAEVRRLEAELAALGITRPVDTIQADVQAARIDQVIWKRSKQCSDVTAPESKDACQPILELYKERGAAARKAEIEPQLASARAKLATIEPPKAADPQAEALARLFGLSPEVIAYLMVAIIGLALELTACLGVWLMSAPSVAPLARLAPAGCKVPNAPASKVAGPIAGLDRLAREIAERGGQIAAENADLARLLGVSPSCASKWRKAWRDAGEIIESRRDGLLVLSLGRRRLKLIHAG